MEARAQVVPRLPVKLGPIAEDQVLQTADARSGELLVVLLDAPLELGEQVIEEEGRDNGEIL